MMNTTPNAKGWIATGAFVSGLLLAAIAFAVVGVFFGLAAGGFAFGLIAVCAGALFIVVARALSASAANPRGKP